MRFSIKQPAFRAFSDRCAAIREDMDAKLLSALIMALIRGVYNPNFFFNHNVSADTVGSIIVNIFMDGILKDE